MLSNFHSKNYILLVNYSYKFTVIRNTKGMVEIENAVYSYILRIYLKSGNPLSQAVDGPKLEDKAEHGRWHKGVDDNYDLADNE